MISLCTDIWFILKINIPKGLFSTHKLTPHPKESMSLLFQSTSKKIDAVPFVWSASIYIGMMIQSIYSFFKTSNTPSSVCEKRIHETASKSRNTSSTFTLLVDRVNLLFNKVESRTMK